MAGYSMKRFIASAHNLSLNRRLGWLRMLSEVG
jgi:hypothetical protein